MTDTAATTATTTLLAECPALKINTVLYSDRPMPTRVKLEQRVVWALFRHMEQRGWSAASVHDGDEETRVRSPKAAMELCFNLDDAYVFFRNAEGKRHYVRLVFGNSPEEVICDWGFTEGDADGFDAAVRAFDAATFI